MAWACSLQMGDFEIHACSIGKEFAGFRLDDPEIAQAIRSKDPRILETLKECLDHWEEICAIMWAGDDLFWDVVYNKRGPKEHVEWWEGCLQVIAKSDMVSDVHKEKAQKALIELAIERGEGHSLPLEEIEIDCTKINDLLAQFDLPSLIFYESNLQLPGQTGGIYLLWDNDILEYIGRSIDVRQRLRGGHRVYRHGQHLIGLIPINSTQKQKVVEVALIGVLHPIYNNQWSLRNLA